MDRAAFQNRWNNELQKNLMVEVFYQEKGIIFTFLDLHLPGPMNIEGRQDNRPRHNNN